MAEAAAAIAAAAAGHTAMPDVLPAATPGEQICTARFRVWRLRVVVLVVQHLLYIRLRSFMYKIPVPHSLH